MGATFLGATWRAWADRFLRPAALISALIWIITDAMGVTLLLRPVTWFLVAILFIGLSVVGMLEEIAAK